MQPAQPPVIDYSQLGPIVAYIFLGLFMLKQVWDLVSPIVNKKLGTNGNGKPGCVPVDVDLRVMASQVQQLCQATTSISTSLLPMTRQIDEMYQWHSVQDDDGVKIWYVRRSFYDAIERHNEELHKLTAILTELWHEQQAMNDHQQALTDEVRTLVKGKS